MMLCRVTGDVVSTVKNEKFRGQHLLLLQEVELDGRTPVKTSFLGIDRVGAGVGDLVLVLKEGGGVRILTGDDKIPLSVVIIAIVDELDHVDPATLEGMSTLEIAQAAGGNS